MILLDRSGRSTDGERALAASQEIATGTNDLSDLGLSAAESARLNALLLTVIRAADGRPPGDPLR